MRPSPDLSVYLITDPAQCAARGLVETVRAAVAGGATLVQLRDKGATEVELIAQGRALLAVLAGTGVPLIINDCPAVAAAIGAAGVHLGDDDGGDDDAAVAEARALLGPAAIIGRSVRSPAAARGIDLALIDYLGVGPVFATGTKPDHADPLGFDGLAAVCAASPVPVVAIGGLGLADVGAVLAAGARGVAVVSAICTAVDPTAVASRFAAAVRLAKRPGVAA